MRKPAFIAVFIVLFLVFSGCEQGIKGNKPMESKQAATPIKQRSIKQVPAVEAISQSFEVLPIDEQLEQRISGISWKQGSPVNLDDLSYVRVAYWGFDDKEHFGELIVNKAVAQEVVEIFKELYDKKFPIEKIRLIDEYAANDDKSMEDNNTSSFCYRDVAGKPGKLSKHSYGLAIDINPVQNPYIYKDEITPVSGKAYIDRDNQKMGMIQKDDVCYAAFTSRGWQWGGDWKYEKDYQHFQKNIQIEK